MRWERSNLISGAVAPGHDFRTRFCELAASQPIGSHVSPAPAILHLVLLMNVRRSGCSRATTAKLGISTTIEHAGGPDRRSMSVGRVLGSLVVPGDGRGYPDSCSAGCPSTPRLAPF